MRLCLPECCCAAAGCAVCGSLPAAACCNNRTSALCSDVHPLLQGQRSTSAPLPPQGGGALDGSSDSSGSGSSRSNSSRGGKGGGGGGSRKPSAWRSRRHPRPYARIKFVLRPARDDPHYAEWCARNCHAVQAGSGQG
jgi:hypothetical protein